MITDEVREAVDFVMAYAGDVDDWIAVKKELLKSLPAGSRTSFSTRDPLTKKQTMNAFELELVELWHALGGKRLLFMP